VAIVTFCFPYKSRNLSTNDSHEKLHFVGACMELHSIAGGGLQAVLAEIDGQFEVGERPKPRVVR